MMAASPVCAKPWPAANHAPAVQNRGMKTSCITVYGIAACDTVKKARAWLLAHGIAHDFHDFKKLGVPQDRLDTWLAALGRARLLNTRGTTWRQLSDTARAAVVDDASARALMLSHASVIKRPVVRWADGRVTVGIDEAVWQAHITSQLAPTPDGNLAP